MEMDMELINRTSSGSSLLSPPAAADTSSPLPVGPREFSATATPTPGALKKRPFPASPAAVAPLPLEHASPPSTPVAAVATCNFSALSHHFHLPLKVAAEKFGVRATAFKKRCRAIGIRHWPYRKVRSLKRSLQELAECKAQAENGSGPPLTDKQLRQQAVYQSQLTRLLSPETYGIDPNGQLLPHNFFAMDGATPSTPDDDNDSDDDSCGSQSPRVHPSPAAIHHHRLAALGAGARKTKARKHFFSDSPSSAGAAPHEGMFFYSPVAATSAAIFDSGYLATGVGGPDMPPSSSLNTHAALGFDALYDPFGAMDDFVGNDHPSCGYSLDSVSYDFFPLHPSPTMATRKAALAASSMTSGSTATSTASSSSTTPAADVLEDDIFRHISPEYGCLV